MTCDEAGNRLAMQKAGEAPLTYSYNAADELTSDSTGKSYSYNATGDLTTIKQGTYQKDLTWDGKGRLLSATDTNGLSTSFTYDPLDRTLTSSGGAGSRTHLYDLITDMEMATLRDNDTLDSLFFTGADGLISSTSTDGTSYFSYNPHSDVSLITDQTGNTTKELHYDAWGNTAEQSNETYDYLGKHQRPDYKSPGLIKMGARFYDPETGRFISRDPLKGQDEVPITRNAYVYANDDPVNKTDITGKSAMGDMCRTNALICAARFDFVGAMYWFALGVVWDNLAANATAPAQKPTSTNCPSAPTSTPAHALVGYSGETTWTYNTVTPVVHFTCEAWVKVGGTYAEGVVSISSFVMKHKNGIGNWEYAGMEIAASPGLSLFTTTGEELMMPVSPSGCLTMKDTIARRFHRTLLESEKTRLASAEAAAPVFFMTPYGPVGWKVTGSYEKSFRLHPY